jgi:tetratricopeptide (TPR) repeat protein
VGSDTRFQLWRDAWGVVAAHPAGIGRGAFDRVFPVYRTLQTELTVRFAFVENEPLQMLVDGGWLFFAAIVVAFAFVLREVVRRGRRDRIEAALVAGVFAVLVHSLLDFGLETPGVLLPFAFTLGMIIGRSHSADRPNSFARAKWPVAALGGLGLIVGTAGVAHSSYDDFDALLKEARPAAKAAIVARAQRVHPIDYFYAMADARLQPVRSPSGGPSPRFRSLNRALALCPLCEATHVEVARNLWALGRRGQSLLEWRAAIGIQPKLLRPALGELFAAGARPEELASLAGAKPDRMLEVADFFNSVARVADAIIVLKQAEAAGVAQSQVLVIRAQLQAKSGDTRSALETVAKARAAQIGDARLELVDAELQLRTKGSAGPEAALAGLDAAAVRYPHDLGIQRRRLDLIMQIGKWQAADRALLGLREAIYQNRADISEAYTASARIAARLLHWTEAIGQYRLAVAQAPWNVSLWLEFGVAAEAAGRDLVAREAYAEAVRLSPNDPIAAKALRDLDERAARLRGTILPTQSGAP